MWVLMAASTVAVVIGEVSDKQYKSDWDNPWNKSSIVTEIVAAKQIVFLFFCLSLKVGEIYSDHSLTTSAHIKSALKKHKIMKWVYVIVLQLDYLHRVVVPAHFFVYDSLEEFRDKG